MIAGVRDAIDSFLIQAGVIQGGINTVEDVRKVIAWINKKRVNRDALVTTYKNALKTLGVIKYSTGLPNLLSVCMSSTPENGMAALGLDSWIANDPNGWATFHSDTSDRVGWLGTGDAPLGDAGVREDFTQHFASDLLNIDTILAPHHGAHPKGSQKFFHADILGSARWATISFGSNNPYRHPHPKVVHEIAINHVHPILITERFAPGFCQRVLLEYP